MRATVLASLVILASFASVCSSQAEVRFGRNVFIGGHDFSRQTFGGRRRAVIHLYDRAPSSEGCAWRSDGRGGRVKLCHLRRIVRR